MLFGGVFTTLPKTLNKTIPSLKIKSTIGNIHEFIMAKINFKWLADLLRLLAALLAGYGGSCL